MREQLKLAEKIVMRGEIAEDDQLRLADLILGLNEWLSNGGFLPEMWRQDTTESSRSFDTKEVVDWNEK